MAETAAWERQDGESAKAYQAFRLYRDLGPARSIEAVHQKFAGSTPKSTRLLKRWSSAHAWVDRAAAYDAHLESVRLGVAERAERDRAARWARRRSRLTEREYRLSRRLFAEAERALGGHEEPAVGDQPAVKVPPSPTDLRRIASVVAQASAVARKAIEAETQERMEPHPTQDGPVNPAPIFVSVKPLTQEDVEADRQAREELTQWQKDLGDQLAQSADPRLAPPASMPPSPPPVEHGL